MPRLDLEPIDTLFVTIGQRPFLLTVEETAVSGREVRHIGLAPPWEDHAAWSKLIRESQRRARAPQSPDC